MSDAEVPQILLQTLQPYIQKFSRGKLICKFLFQNYTSKLFTSKKNVTQNLKEPRSNSSAGNEKKDVQSETIKLEFLSKRHNLSLRIFNS